MTLQCSLCKKSLPMTMFDKAKVKEWLRADSLLFAECLACQPTRSDAQKYPCTKCKRKLPLGASGPQGHSRHDLSKWRCDNCSRPTCIVCGRQPTAPVTHSIDPESYRCQACLYPSCRRCGATRPSKAKRQSKNVDAKPNWMCSACRKRPSEDH